jgi:hypothetical protein
VVLDDGGPVLRRGVEGMEEGFLDSRANLTIVVKSGMGRELRGMAR